MKWRSLIALPGCGLVVGTLMDLPLLWPRVGDVVERLPVLNWIWEAINSPAIWATTLYLQTGLPHYGEGAWVVVPAIAIPIQWFLLGIVAAALRLRLFLPKTPPDGE